MVVRLAVLCSVDDDRPGGPRRSSNDEGKVVPHGLAAPGASRLLVLSDFLLFCKLCVARGFIPRSGWDWDELVQASSSMLDKAFSPERGGGVARYGDAGSASCLRKHARLVRDSDGEVLSTMHAQIRAACWGEDSRADDGCIQHQFSFDRDDTIFDDVGGVDAWKKLNEELKKTRLGRM